MGRARWHVHGVSKMRVFVWSFACVSCLVFVVRTKKENTYNNGPKQIQRTACGEMGICSPNYNLLSINSLVRGRAWSSVNAVWKS
jgi:hypothetical protein